MRFRPNLQTKLTPFSRFTGLTATCFCFLGMALRGGGGGKEYKDAVNKACGGGC